jgi:Domain of unknown function DUF29
MIKQTVSPPRPLYEEDETAWLELTAGLVAEGRFGEIDRAALAEYLTDMAKRDKREVASRLTVLMTHVLKWEHQPKGRAKSWRATIISQQDELEDLLDSSTLRKHASEILAKCYAKAVRRAAAETGLPVDRFPQSCPYSVEHLLAVNK